MSVSELYQSKYENFQKAMNRQEGAYIPNILMSNGGPVFWTGKTVFDVIGDPATYADAMTAVLSEMWIDANVLCSGTTTPRRDAAFPTSESRYAKDGTLTHIQEPRMQQDEYGQLIADPRSFVANVLLPRKYDYLFESREKTKELMKVMAEENFYNRVELAAATKRHLAEKYGVHTFVAMNPVLNTPMDHIFDFLRGFRGTLTDLRRQPANVKAAADAIWEYRWAEKVSQPYNAANGFPFQPCHIPAYLSPKQFTELYWPYEKRLIEWVAASGSKVFLIMEGRWEKIWNCFLDVPKDSVVLYADDDDVTKLKAELGHHQIVMGGLKIADMRLKNFEQIRDDVKRVIDTRAPGGGFLLCPDKGLLTPGDVNRTLIDTYNFAHEYSSKK